MYHRPVSYKEFEAIQKSVREEFHINEFDYIAYQKRVKEELDLLNTGCYSIAQIEQGLIAAQSMYTKDRLVSLDIGRLIEAIENAGSEGWAGEKVT